MTRAWLALALCACRFNFEPLTDDGGLTGDGDANLGGDSADAADRPNRVFLTSTLHAATFGSVAAADSICQTHATAAGLDGTFVALVANVARPEPRLAGSRGWVDVTGTPIVDEPATWLDGYMFHPLRRDETGADLGYTFAWVGTIYDCSGWASTAMMGSIVTSSDAFGAYTVQSCGQTARFICAETGHVAPVAPTTVSGRRAFLTTTQWTPSGGIAGADAFCAGEATTHGLAGTYRALLATSSLPDPFSRLSLTGPTWTRIDGVAIAPTAAALASASTTWLDSFSHVRPDGSRYPYATMWIGDAGENCNDWTSSNMAQRGLVGDPAAAFRDFWSGFSANATCDIPRHLLCLEE